MARLQLMAKELVRFAYGPRERLSRCGNGIVDRHSETGRISPAATMALLMAY